MQTMNSHAPILHPDERVSAFEAVDVINDLCLDAVDRRPSARTLLTLKQAAAHSGISAKVLRRASLAGRIPFIRNGESATAKILLRPHDLDAYVKTLENRRTLSPFAYAECRREAGASGALQPA